MGLSRVLIKYCTFLMLFGFGYHSFFTIKKHLVTHLRWLQENLHLQEAKQPPNNMTYPAFRHPLAPPYPYPYKFLFSQADKCKGRSPFLVIMVVGEVNDIESRHAIRNTWGNLSLYDVDIVRIFLVGLSNIAPERVQMLLKEENSIYGDIVQQDFMDTYYNLTLKTLMGLEWVNKFCATASYVMKIDNDVFFNVDFLVHKYLYPELPVRANFFTGDIINGTRPLRNPIYRGHIPKEIYPDDFYPPYCSGPGYVLSVDMAQKIYDISQVIRVIPVEDAFMGICLQELKIPLTQPPKGIFNGGRIDYDRCLFHKLVTVHYYDKEELLIIWNNFWKKKTTGCDRRRHKRRHK
ncbi:beta-1,3-galactosyltransferase 2-like [Gastrophryne carolinensis]